MSYNTAEIRKLLTAALSDVQLTTLCYDYFRPVHNQFTDQMDLQWKIHLLIAHCESQKQFDRLLTRIQEANPAQYNAHISRILSPTTRQVLILFRGDFFTEGSIQSAPGALASVLDISLDQIHILTVTGGNTIFRLELPTKAAQSLIALYRSGDASIFDLGIQYVELAVYKTLDQPHYPTSIDLLSKALKDKNVVALVRSQTANALGQSGDPRAVEPLRESLKDKVGAVRLAAVEALNRLKYDWPFELLQNLSRDEVGDVREQTIRILGRSQDQRAVEILLEILGYRAVCRKLYKIAKTLGLLGILHKSRDTIGDRDAAVRLAAVNALEQLRCEWPPDLVVKLSRDPDPAVRLQAVNILGQFNTPRAVKTLQARLENEENDTVKSKIIGTLKQLKVDEDNKLPKRTFSQQPAVIVVSVLASLLLGLVSNVLASLWQVDSPQSLMIVLGVFGLALATSFRVAFQVEGVVPTELPSLVMRAFAVLGSLLLVIGIFETIVVQPPPPPASFSYQVRVQAKETGQGIPNAKVTLEVIGKAPLTEITDSNGLARIIVDASYVGSPGRLLVEANGYNQHRQEISLTVDILPITIQLEPAVMPSIIPTPTHTSIFTPTPTSTPTPTLSNTPTFTPPPTPTSTSTSTPTNTPTLTATRTNTPTPTRTLTNTPRPATPTSTFTPAPSPTPTQPPHPPATSPPPPTPAQPRPTPAQPSTVTMLTSHSHCKEGKGK